MSGSRERILGAVKRSLGGGGSPAEVEARIAGHRPGPIPARADLPPAGRLDLFEAETTAVETTLERLSDLEEVPEAVARYLAAHNLAASVRHAPEAWLSALPWERAPLLEVSGGPARASDPASVTGAFAGIAETGTLMLTSGAERPTLLNFLPETHVVVLRAEQVVGTYEEAWTRLRAELGEGVMPRTVNFVTGPSRSADIEQTLQLGAHGPKRLHILLVGEAEEGSGGNGKGDE